MDKYKEILPLAEQIVAMQITISELIALKVAVSETSELYNIPTSTAAFWVINDIREYHKIGGLKKQLAALCAQVYAVEELCSNQYQAIVTLLKLQSYGLTGDQILLYLNDFLFERNMMNNKINPESLAADLEQYGSMKRS